MQGEAQRDASDGGLRKLTISTIVAAALTSVRLLNHCLGPGGAPGNSGADRESPEPPPPGSSLCPSPPRPAGSRDVPPRDGSARPTAGGLQPGATFLE